MIADSAGIFHADTATSIQLHLLSRTRQANDRFPCTMNCLKRRIGRRNWRAYRKSLEPMATAERSLQ
jgi:hypothetical protein